MNKFTTEIITNLDVQFETAFQAFRKGKTIVLQYGLQGGLKKTAFNIQDNNVVELLLSLNKDIHIAEKNQYKWFIIN